MTRVRTILRATGCAIALVALHASAADASPTMIRLGYSDCAACHLSPQGGGLLTTYGKGVDVAQSLRAREYEPSSRQRRLLFDARVLMTGHRLADSRSSAPAVSSSAFRLMLRSAVQTSERSRITYTMGVESPTLSASPRPVGLSGSANLFIGKALFEYRPKDGLEISVGRDELPNGLGLPDPQAFMRRGTDPGATAYPTQIKAFWWNSRFQVTPYVFGPGGDEAPQFRQYGAGILGGVDVWKQRAVIGLSGRTSHGPGLDRNAVGAFARLGFGRWGIFAEHELASRVTRDMDPLRSEHFAGHTQVFFAPYEWLVTSLSAEHLVVEGAGARHVVRLAPAAQIRVSENLTVMFSTRDAFSSVRPERSRTYSVQFAVKTVQ